MALHCPATLLLVEGEVPDGSGTFAAEHGPWGDGVDVMAELQALADLHRGERVLVRLPEGATAHVLHELGRVVPDDSPTVAVWLEVGDDGWTVVPPAGEPAE